MGFLRRTRTVLAGPELRIPDFRRLVGLRLLGHLGDGVHQAVLGGVVLFSPTHRTDPLEIAAGFAILLLPYSLIGPFAAATLDRFDRRRVLAAVTAVRAAVMLASAALVASGAPGRPGGVTLLFTLALVLAAAGRFGTTGVAAALPLTLPPGRLLVVNSVLTTVAAGVTATGALTAMAVLAILGAGDAAAATAILVAAVTAALGFLPLLPIAPGRLGPTAPGDTAGAVTAAPPVHPARGFVDGARAVWGSPRTARAIVALGAHRFAFGVDTLVIVLILRDHPGPWPPGGLAGFGAVVSAITVGMFLAAIVVPILLPRLGLTRTVVYSLAVLAVVQTGVIAWGAPVALVPAGVAFGCAGQVIKLSADSSMFLDIADSDRGRVFAFQDMLFNAVFAVAVAAAAVANRDGVATGGVALCVAAGVLYALAAAWAPRDRRRRG